MAEVTLATAASVAAMNTRLSAVEAALAGGGGPGEPTVKTFTDIREFGVVVRDLTDPALGETPADENRARVQQAIDASASEGIGLMLPSGSVDVNLMGGALINRLGATIRGVSKFNSAFTNVSGPRSLTEAWPHFFDAPPVVAQTGGNGRGFFSDFRVSHGWNMRDFLGQTDRLGNWDADPARMTGNAFNFNTPSGGPGASAVREAGSDAHNRLMNLFIENVPGYAVNMEGRGENFILGLETSRCGKSGIRNASPDNWIMFSTVYLNMDNGIETLSAAGDCRMAAIKSWFNGMGRRQEMRGAGYYFPDAGTLSITMEGCTTQDNWGAGIDMQGDTGILFSGGILDECGGGRLEAQTGTGGGWQGTRTLPRCFIRLPGTLRGAYIQAVIRGGNRNGAANRPFLVDLMGAGVLRSLIELTGSLDYIRMESVTSGLPSGRIAQAGVLTTTGHRNANAYNRIMFHERMLHGFVTQAMMDNPAHGVNDALYGPTEVIRDDGRKFVKLPANVGAATPVWTAAA